MDCDFCERILQPGGQRPWYDFRVLGEDEHFLVVPALGSIVPGHILLVSRRHVTSLAQLTELELMFLAELVNAWSSRIAESWGTPVYGFEHGSAVGKSVRACIAHAHLQLLPLSSCSCLEKGFVESRNWTSLAALAGIDYLLAYRPGSIGTRSHDEGTSQYLRRRLLKKLGRENECDYLVYPNLDAMRETIHRLAQTAVIVTEGAG